MIDLKADCEMVILSNENTISGFDCGNRLTNHYEQDTCFMI